MQPSRARTSRLHHPDLPLSACRHASHRLLHLPPTPFGEVAGCVAGAVTVEAASSEGLGASPAADRRRRSSSMSLLLQVAAGRCREGARKAQRDDSDSVKEQEPPGRRADTCCCSAERVGPALGWHDSVVREINLGGAARRQHSMQVQQAGDPCSHCTPAPTAGAPDWQRRYSSKSSLQLSEGPPLSTLSPCSASTRGRQGEVVGHARTCGQLAGQQGPAALHGSTLHRPDGFAAKRSRVGERAPALLLCLPSCLPLLVCLPRACSPPTGQTACGLAHS